MLTRIHGPKGAATVAAGPRRFAAGVLAAACVVCSMFSPQAVRAGSSAEYEIKAAFMYNFAKFVQWPATAFAHAQSPLILCVIGQDQFGAALDTIDHKVAQQRELQVRRRVHLEDAKSCHILFIAQSERARLASILRAVSGAGVLTVSDIDRFAEAGGVIGFYDLDNKLQFSINPEQARSSLLQINSQLLKLAKIVRSDAREAGR